MASSISPSAATYPHPTFLIGYSNFPFAAGPAYTPYPPPASTYAATYPYPPPSSTHTPEPPVFSPNWPAWPPHPPDPSPSTAPSTTKGERTTLRDGGVLQSEKSSSAVHPAKPVTCQDGDLGKGSNTSGAPIHGVHKHSGHGTFSKANASTTHRFFMEDEVAVQAAADKRVPAKNTTCHGHQRKHLNLHARLDEQQARDRTAINSLQGQLAKLELMASQMATAMSMQITEVPTTESSPTVASAPYTSPAAPAYVDPQVLGETPTSIAWQGTQGIVSNYSSGHHDPIQCSSVSTLSEQNLGPVFDVYDDDMDGCSTEIFDVFLGTPEQQKSDQFANGFCEALNAFTEGTPERVSHAYDVDTKGRTDESVHVFASPPEQQPYEAQQQDSEQLLTCISKATASEQSGAYLNYISAVPDYTLEQQQNDAEKTPVNLQQLRHTVVGVFSLGTDQKPDTKLCVKYVKPQVSNQQWNTHMTEAARKEWDPGDLQTIMDVPVVVKWSSFEGLTHAVNFSPNILLSMNAYVAKSIPNILVSSPLYIQWDSGDTTYHVLCTTTSGATKLQCVDIYKPTMVQILAVQFLARKVPKQSCYCRVPSSHENLEVQFLWDPGILNQMVTRLEETAVANPVHSMQTLFKLLFFIEQPVGLKFWTQLCHSWCSTPVFLQELHAPMIKTNNCTSTSIGVASSEYTYIVDFLPDQWEFLHRQDVQKNAKNLLLSENSLWTWEMDIIFITFLPP